MKQLINHIKKPKNVYSNSYYWLFRKAVEQKKKEIEIERENWKKGFVPFDENTEKTLKNNNSHYNLTLKDEIDVFVYDYGGIPCYCLECRVNNLATHYKDGGRYHTFGYIIGKQEKVIEKMNNNLTTPPHHYTFGKLNELDNDRAVVLYKYFYDSFE